MYFLQIGDLDFITFCIQSQSFLDYHLYIQILVQSFLKLLFYKIATDRRRMPLYTSVLHFEDTDVLDVCNVV